MTTAHRHHQIICVPSNEQVPLARRAVLDTFRKWGLDTQSDVAHTVRLIVSELLTNAVRYSSTVTAEITLTVEIVDGTRIRLGVHDLHPHCPSPSPAPPEASRGRGLQIVRDLVRELKGTAFTERTDDGGKTQWVELPMTEQAAESRTARVLFADAGVC
ncbi:ATP-binding protein [Streptomyces sp. NPDC020996]|uniref:ATP-binding protein n=1 Tax=Streptomyces sp. NPDC020996 TaxID=3154791 RepID=UPI0033F0394D